MPRKPSDQAVRDRIQSDLQTNLLIEAGAGTGKTTQMVNRMLSLIETGHCSIEHIAAVTFTRKAASELRERFHARLADLGARGDEESTERRKQAWIHRERCFIGTIHAFCGQLLRERPIEAGLDVDFQELDDTAETRLREQLWQSFVTGDQEEDLRAIDRLESLGVSLSQLRAAFDCMVAYPDVDQWPISEQEPPPVEELRDRLETWSREVEGLLDRLPSERGNDSLMSRYEELVRRIRTENLQSPSTVMELVGRFCVGHGAVQKIWKSAGLDPKPEIERWNGMSDALRPFLKRWLEFRHREVLNVARDLARRYAELRQRSGYLSFTDLLLRSIRLLKSHSHVRRQLAQRFRCMLVDEFQDTDPLQAEMLLLLTADDHHEPDWRRCRPRAGSLFVVGDPKQSIYRFRRADIETFEAVKQVIQESGGQSLSLTTNFRTTKSLVDWANSVFTVHFPPVADRFSPAACPLVSGRTPAKLGDDARHSRDGSAKPHFSGLYQLVTPDGNKADTVPWEADAIARTIRQALDDGWTVERSLDDVERESRPRHVEPSDFLILTYKKDLIPQITAALETYRIPYDSAGGNSLGSIPEFEAFLTLLRALANPESAIDLVAVLRGPLFGFADEELFCFRKMGGRFTLLHEPPNETLPEELEELVATVAQLRTYLRLSRGLSVVGLIDRMVNDFTIIPHLFSDAGGDQRAGTFKQALEQLRERSSEFGSISDCITHLELVAGLQESNKNVEFDAPPLTAKNSGFVRVMNLHKAKGLEAPIVFLAGTTGVSRIKPKQHIVRSPQGTMGYIRLTERNGNQETTISQSPNWETFEADEQEFLDRERRRLLYVAATRPKSCLVVTCRTLRAGSSPWSDFFEFLGDAPSLPLGRYDSGSVKIAFPNASEPNAQLLRDTAELWRRGRRPGYELVQGKTLGASVARTARGRSPAESGIAWGSVLHQLLEASVRTPDIDRRSMAESLLSEVGESRDLAPLACEWVGRVLSSALWQRATESPRRLVETPFTIALPHAEAEPRRFQRGVVDLAFEESDGWVIVDYKSDSVVPGHEDQYDALYRPQLEAYAAAWEQVPNTTVKELGVFYLATGDYREVSRSR